MTKIILIIFIAGGIDTWDYGPSITTAEFESVEACNAAGNAMKQKFRQHELGSKDSRTIVEFVCAPKK